MTDRTKPQKEADLYKDSSTLKLKRVIFTYKFLSLSNSRTSNFIITLLCILIPYLIFLKFSLFTLTLALLFHYLVFWKYMYEKKNSKLVSDKDKEEIDEIVKILVSDLENRKNKKPL
jgi:predicted membrane protein